MTETTNPRQNEPRRGSSAPVWGIILLFFGVVLLLQTFNILPWGCGGTLWRFWPAFIIIIGLTILLRNVSAWLVSLIVIAILGGSLGSAIAMHGTGGVPAGVTMGNYTQPLGTVQTANVDIDFTAGSLTVDKLNNANESG